MNKEILLLHGALGSKKQFSEIAKHIHAKVHTINFSGHGGLPMPSHFNTGQFAKDVIEYLDENQIDQIDVFGYSLGGYVALYTAFLFPERIGKIVTLSTKFDWTSSFAEEQVLKLNPDIVESKVPRFAAHLADEHAPEDWKLIMDKTAEMMVGLSLVRPLTANSLRQISHLVTLGIGEQDKMVSTKETEEASSKLQNGIAKVLPAPHEIDKIQPQLVANFITESLI